MRLNKHDTIAGFSVGAVRDLLRRHYPDQVAPVRWPHELHTTPAEAKRLLQELEQLGYLKPSAHYADRWAMTEQGIAFRLARLTKPYRRETAARALDSIVERAQALEGADHPFVFRVSKLRVYGSFLREDVDQVGGLDIALDLVGRYANSAVQEREAEKRWRDPKWGPARNLVDELSRPRTEVLRYLKGGSPVISLAPIEDQPRFWKRIAWRTVYELAALLRKGDPDACSGTE